MYTKKQGSRLSQLVLGKVAPERKSFSAKNSNRKNEFGSGRAPIHSINNFSFEFLQIILLKKMLPLFSQFKSTSPRVRNKNGSFNQGFTNRQQAVWVKVMPHPLMIKQEALQIPQERERIWQQLSHPSHKMKLQQKMQGVPSGKKILCHSTGGWSAAYCLRPWVPTTADHNRIPFKIPKVGKDSYLVRSPDRKIGLADSGRRTSRIKAFGLADALLHAYLRDIRFVLITCLLIGFSLWWLHVTEELLIKPMALTSPDLELLVRVARETFLDHICSLHHVPSPD